MINRLRNEKGITLIALVVTIIVILILAFISLSLVLGQDGLFKKASDAGKLQKIKNTQEILEVQALSARANTVLSGENVVDEFLNIIKKDNLITDNDIDEEYGLFITVDGLEFKIEEEKNNVKIIYQGEKDKLTPSIQTCIINNTTNSITVETSGRNINSFNYYIKESEEGEYELKGNNTTGKYAYLDLEQDKTYYIKIEAVNNNGTDVKEYTKTTGTVTAGTEEGAIVFSNVTWNPSTHTASISLSTNTDYTIQYKVSGKITTWTAGTTVSGLVHSDTVYARLFDGTNGGSSASLTIEDRIAPNVTLTQGTVKSNIIQINALAEDNQSGMDDAPVYNFYIKKKSEDNSSYVLKQNNTTTTCTFTGLEQEVDYVIKVTTQDLAENIGEQTIEAKTGIVTIATGNITCSTPVWSNKKASVTLSTELNEYTIQYKVNSGSWTEGTIVNNLSHGDTVYARLFDGTNGGSSVSFNIQDNEAPTVTLTQGTVTNTTIQVSATAVDSKSGISNSAIYNFYIKRKNDTNGSFVLKQNNTTASYTFTGLESGVIYEIKVTVEDIAGNVGEKIIETVTQTMIVNISLEANKTTLIGGNVPESVNITNTITPLNAGNKSLQWASSNPNVATVDQTGKVTAGYTPGTTIITATSKDGSNKSASIEIDVNKIIEYFVKDGDILTTKSFGTPQIVWEAKLNNEGSLTNANEFGIETSNQYTGPLAALLYNKTAFEKARTEGKFYNRKENNSLHFHSELIGSANGYGIILERGNDAIPDGKLVVDFSMEEGSWTRNWAFTHSEHYAGILPTEYDEPDAYKEYLGNESKVWKRNTTVNNKLASDYTSGSYEIDNYSIGTNNVPAIVICAPGSGYTEKYTGVYIRNYYFIYGNKDYIKLNLNNQEAASAGTTSLYYKSTTSKYYYDAACTRDFTNNKITLPTKRGYTFGGYYTQPNGSGTQYINASGYFTNNTSPVITQDLTLYAKWIPNTITITLNAKNATTTGTTIFYYKYGTPVFYSNAACTTQITQIVKPTKNSSVFLGYYVDENTGIWYITEDGLLNGMRYINENGAFIYNLHTRVYEDTVLYAHWE